MNKFITKIVGAALGLTLAIGVGVAVGVNNSEAREVSASYSSVSTLSVGDVVVFAYEKDSTKKELTGVVSDLGTATNYSTAGSPNGTFKLTVELGNGGTGYSFKNGDNYLCWKSNPGGNKLYTSTTKDDASSWTIKDGSTAGSMRFVNVGTTGRNLAYNASSPRWCAYTSDQTGFIVYKFTAPAVSSVSLNKNSTTIEIGGSEQLTATVLPNDAANKNVNWSKTGDSDITVSDTGLVSVANTATVGDTATITATSAADNTKSASCTVTVKAQVVYTEESIRIEDESKIVKDYAIGDGWDNSAINVQLVKGGDDQPKTYQYVNLTENLTFVYKNSSSEVMSSPATANGVTLTVTCSDYPLFSFTSASFNVTVSDLSGTYNITSKATAYDDSVTVETFKSKTNNSSDFTITLNKVRLYCTPGGSSGDVGKTSDIVLSASDAYLTFSVPSAYFITRVETNVSTKSTSVGTVTVGDASASNVVNSARTLIVAHPFASSFTISTTHWIYMEYINIVVTKVGVVNDLASAYGVAFNDLTHTECAALAGISAATWTKVEAVYDLAVAANASLEGTLKTAEAVQAGNDLGQAMFRYDMIKTKYSKTDFLGRFGVGGINAAININNGLINSNNGTTTLVIILVASISLVAVSGFFVIRRRREN